MKVAVVGAGNWGKNLVRTFSQLGALGAVVETNASLRADLAAQYPGVPLLDGMSALEQTGLTAVAIATPVATHFALVRESLERGLDVFVEKPITLSSKEAETLQRLAEKHQRVLMLGHLLRYQPAILWMSLYLKEGGIGRFHSLHQE